jgi:outer membrane protein OmpA-like peptidoglycan-associated protein
MKKIGLLSIALLMSLPGCGGRKTIKANKRGKQQSEVRMNVDIPVAEEEIKSFFDEDIKEFTLAQEMFANEQDVDSAALINAYADAELSGDEFSWIDEVRDTQEFELVHFDFDSYVLQKDQEKQIAHDVARAQKMVKESRFFGDDAKLPTIVIEGHACHSAGGRAYNLALSEKRAKVLSDKFIQAGIPQECIKIVGRGSEIPAIVDGKAVTGDRHEQAPNRRDEIRVLYS